jgi:hypothetical protein
MRDGTRPWDESRAPEIDRVAKILLAAWMMADPTSDVALHPASYVATFADMARAIIADREAQRLATKNH